MLCSFGCPIIQRTAKLEAAAKGSEDITSLCNKSYEERLASLNLFSLEKRRLRNKLIKCFKILKGFTNVYESKLLSIDYTSRTRSNGVKLKCKQVQLDSTKLFFTNDVIWEWNKLPPSLVQCDTINSRTNLTTTSSTKVSDKSKLSDVLPAV